MQGGHAGGAHREKARPRPASAAALASRAARESLRAALAVQAEAFRALGIAVKVRKGTRRNEFETVHWPEICCQKTIHAPQGKAGACHAHRPYGRSRFCAECAGADGPWHD
jgi:hypothetical protein